MAARIRSHLLSISMAAVAVAGCTVLAPQSDRSRFYILAPASAGEISGSGVSAVSTSDQGLSIGVGPIYTPEYLQHRELAERIGPTRIEYSDLDRWAEPPNESLPRVLAENLSRDLGSDRVVVFPWSTTMRIHYQIEVSVERFDINDNSQAELKAHWLIRDPIDGGIVDSGSTLESEPAGKDGSSETAALSQTLASLSSQLALRLRHLQETRARNVGQSMFNQSFDQS